MLICVGKAFFVMANSVPTVLILGHSFIKRLRQDLESGFHGVAKPDFGLQGSATVHLFGVGGHHVQSPKNGPSRHFSRRS